MIRAGLVFVVGFGAMVFLSAVCCASPFVLAVGLGSYFSQVEDFLRHPRFELVGRCGRCYRGEQVQGLQNSGIQVGELHVDIVRLVKS